MWSENYGTRNGWYGAAERFNAAAIDYQTNPAMNLGGVISAARIYSAFLDGLEVDCTLKGILNHEKARIGRYLEKTLQIT